MWRKKIASEYWICAWDGRYWRRKVWKMKCRFEISWLLWSENELTLSFSEGWIKPDFLECFEYTFTTDYRFKSYRCSTLPSCSSSWSSAVEPFLRHAFFLARSVLLTWVIKREHQGQCRTWHQQKGNHRSLILCQLKLLQCCTPSLNVEYWWGCFLGMEWQG